MVVTMEASKEQKRNLSIILTIIIALASLSTGAIIGYFASSTWDSDQIDNLQDQLSTVQEQINNLQTKPEAINQNQSDVLELIADLQDQLSIIRNQVYNLQASSASAQDTYEIMDKIRTLQSQISTLQEQINSIETTPDITYILGENASLSQLFEQVRESVVTIQALVSHNNNLVIYQGSGFVYNDTGQMGP